MPFEAHIVLHIVFHMIAQVHISTDLVFATSHTSERQVLLGEAKASLESLTNKANLECSKNKLFLLQEQNWLQEDGKEAAALRTAMQTQKHDTLVSIISRTCRMNGALTHAQAEIWLNAEMNEVAEMAPRMDKATIGTIIVADLAAYGQCWSAILPCILQTFTNDTIANPANTVCILLAPTMPVYGHGWQECGKFSTWKNKFNHRQSLPI
jgi:hypothetical protein